MRNQYQHRISQVYLRQFGYKDKNGKKWLSVWEIGSEYTDNKSIKSFSAEKNIFDLPFVNPNERRKFEELNGDIETYYPIIIEDLNVKQKLTEKSKGYLISFIVNLLCRSKSFREQINTFLQTDQRDYLLTEITVYHSDRGNQLRKSLEKIKINDQLNIILFSAWYYLCKKLTSSNFDYVILKDFSNRGWVTSDNPVVIKKNINDQTLLSKETEIYFPISPNYLFYLDHMDYNKSNSLRVNNQELAQSSEELHAKIQDLIWKNAEKFFIFPIEIKRTKISKTHYK